ncbi:MAG TPA: DNA gyrase subunit A, partial [Trinickia sp.]|nr:DNA gyrase subunit A [Trinickia sp.]
GGGQIISSEAEIAAAYETGRGSLKMRARWKIEDLARGQWQLVVTELPPNTSGQKVLEEIEELTNPKVKLGKKTLTPEQLQTKQTMLALVDAVRDESGKDAPVRLVFEPKSSRIEQTEFVNSLLAHTSLESNAPLNLVMIGADGRPRQKGLIDILGEWIGFRFATVTRRTRHRLTKVDDRIHILEGRMIVFLNIDEVIRIIREAEEPKPALIAAFGLSERQADDILDIRLRQLARLEKIKIEKELEALRDEKTKLEELLGSDTAMKRQIVKEIEADAKQYGDERRTLIQQEKRATFEARVVDEPVTVVVSQRGWVRALKGHGLDAAGFTFKDGDSLYAAFQCRTPDTLIAWGSSGRVYSVAVALLPGGRGDGVPVTSLIELEAGTRLMHYYAASAEQALLLASSNGFGFIAKVGDMVSRQKAGKAFMTIDAGAAPLVPMPVMPSATQVACLSSTGRLAVFGLDEMKTLAAGGRGITLMTLDANETLVQALAIGPAGVVLMGTGRGGKPQEERLAGAALEPHVGKRARRGRAPDTRLKIAALRPELG